MRILIVSATIPEVSFLPFDFLKGEQSKSSVFTFLGHQIDVLVTGVGMVLTAFYLGRHLQHTQYDLAINIGLAGALNSDLSYGQVVQVSLDSFGDLGAEDDEKFLDVFKLKLEDENMFPFTKGKLYANSIYQLQLGHLKSVEGITINTVHGNDHSIQQFRNRISAEVETMEGAAFLYACNFSRIASIQLRSISNYVEKRDKSKWNIPLALNNLKAETELFLKSISKTIT